MNQDNTTIKSVEGQRLVDKINESKMPEKLKAKAMVMIDRVEILIKAGNYTEYEAIDNFINWITQIPFGLYTKDDLDLTQTKKELDQHHYGLEDVKHKILEYLAVLKLNTEKLQEEFGIGQGGEVEDMKVLKGSSANAPVLLFIGIQGIGKTSMAKSIANALGRKFVRISLGGLASVNELRGRSRGLPEAEPGQVVKALISSGSMNPVILFDELDKVSDTGGTRSDVMAALLEILDPEQNATFVDRYIDHPLDISKCMFICTANNLGGITSALLDRLEIVRFTSYSDEDKIQIAKHYLLPKIRKATGLGEDQFTFADDVWDLVVRPLGFDAGIRELERTLTNVARKVAMQIVEGHVDKIEVNADNFRTYIPEDFGVYT